MKANEPPTSIVSLIRPAVPAPIVVLVLSNARTAPAGRAWLSFWWPYDAKPLTFQASDSA
jgi:hypothetical protein